MGKRKGENEDGKGMLQVRKITSRGHAVEQAQAHRTMINSRHRKTNENNQIFTQK